MRATLSRWLFGKACSMVAVGAATALGLWLLGVQDVLGDPVTTPSER